MQDVRVTIDQIEEPLKGEERHSPWIDRAYRDLKKVVKKAGTVRIVAKKTGPDRYALVVGHHLLKAARECGLRDIQVHVTDTRTCRTREDLLMFRLGVEETLFYAAARHDHKTVLTPSVSGNGKRSVERRMLRRARGH